MEREQIALYAFRKFGDTALQAAYCCCGNRQAAEEIAQEVFLALHENPPSFAGDPHLKTYIIRSIIRIARERSRSLRYRMRIRFSPDSERNTADSDIREMLSLIAKLPPEHSAAVYLHDSEGYSLRDIARTLKRDEETVQTLIDEGRELLCIEPEAAEVVS